jgi:hypothetical protein
MPRNPVGDSPDQNLFLFTQSRSKTCHPISVFHTKGVAWATVSVSPPHSLATTVS